MAAKAEVGSKESSSFIAGNSWEFSPRNRWLTPAIYKNEFRDIHEIPETVKRLVQGIQTAFIHDEWQFASVMGNNKGFAVVFVHPKRTAITQSCPYPDFLSASACSPQQRNVWENTSLLPIEQINSLLEGTNLLAYNCYGSYNEIEQIGRRGFFGHTEHTSLYYQTGVAYVLANLHTVDEEIALTDLSIQSITQEFMDKLRPYHAERERILTLRTPNPKPFL